MGDTSKSAPYVVRVKVPADVKLMPHRHHEDRVYTVMSGVFYIGVGEQFDDEKLEAYAPGAVIVLPGGTPHFHWAKSGEYVTQVTAIGPISLDYVDPADDPRASGPRRSQREHRRREAQAIEQHQAATESGACVLSHLGQNGRDVIVAHPRDATRRRPRREGSRSMRLS